MSPTPSLRFKHWDLQCGRRTLPAQLGPTGSSRPLARAGWASFTSPSRSEPIRRRVALKIIKPGMDTREVLARFDAERQALAVMNHPNVAKVFDAGATEQGRPYFVMEYVPGIRITEYCDLRCLSVRERLELFTKVCEAIQHAHQKGIIHRDIKPSNVLVAAEDGKPVPKVIDFGLAKATRPAADRADAVHAAGLVHRHPGVHESGTGGENGLDVDARTDIYSLGVLLYELLAGALPFDPATLRRAAAVEMLRIIQEEDPPRPTTKFSSLGSTAAGDRAAAPHRRSLSGSSASRRAGMDHDARAGEGPRPPVRIGIGTCRRRNDGTSQMSPFWLDVRAAPTG